MENVIHENKLYVNQNTTKIDLNQKQQKSNESTNPEEQPFYMYNVLKIKRKLYMKRTVWFFTPQLYVSNIDEASNNINLKQVWSKNKITVFKILQATNLGIYEMKSIYFSL